MKKLAALAAVFMLVMVIGCGNNNNNNGAAANQNGANANIDSNANGNADQPTDAVTSASVVDNEANFKKAISKEGTWIIATLKDLTFSEDLVLDGQFTNKDKPARKIALYSQDADHNITASFTLTAPKITIKSENARIQGGTFVGDVYVEAKGFQVVNATIQGNVYFASDEFQSTYSAADQGKVTGVTEVQK
ncbi:hypothetical protein H1230_10035 [Paenibacillus sp. 19GGS1-52]|uniref:hypothetical protein n=1 Tax=Paenibacillus sp. 19GGS1-52 TaxID=2758563 RepID=UPI001EFA73B9|nr:hypothetical protein [Paenibacillus sp. 19GGS1-52]ULO09070.1 hypothetical protein H1230_10035 [Paenibacillus sp. 19GGS1-52]